MKTLGAVDSVYQICYYTTNAVASIGKEEGEGLKITLLRASRIKCLAYIICPSQSVCDDYPGTGLQIGLTRVSYEFGLKHLLQKNDRRYAKIRRRTRPKTMDER